MIWALANDLLQRGLTLNKLEQRRNLRRLLRDMPRPPGAAVLDFGCGTGLFARVLAERGRYTGYDPDAALIRYAASLYRDLHFVSDLAAVAAAGPYDLIVANCCFHHISDGDLAAVIDAIHACLAPAGHFLLLDLVDVGSRPSWRHIYRWLEQGESIRDRGAYRQLLAGSFTVVDEQRLTAHLFSTPLSPFYSPMDAYLCEARQTSD